MASISGAVQFHKEVHEAHDTNASVQIAFNKEGFCVKHADIQLRKKKSVFSGGGWKVLLPECPRCALEFKLKIEREAAGAPAPPASSVSRFPVW